MGKQSDWLVVHHLQCKMSAMCFRFYCATNLLFKRYILQFVQRYGNSKTALNTSADKKSRTMYSVDRFQVHVEGCLRLCSVQLY